MDLVELISEAEQLIVCDCDREQRDAGALPSLFVQHANWCNARTRAALIIRALLDHLIAGVGRREALVKVQPESKASA